MKTIALGEQTFEVLKRLKERERLRSFEMLLRRLVRQSEGVKDSMLGCFKGQGLLTPRNAPGSGEIEREYPCY